MGHHTLLERAQPLVGYAILVIFLVASLAIFRHQEAKNLERVERESIERKEQVKREVCNAVIETDKTLVRIIEVATRPRETDSPGEAVRRASLRKELLSQLSRDAGCGMVPVPASD